MKRLLAPLPRKPRKWAMRLYARAAGTDPLTGAPVRAAGGLTRLGSDYGGWVVPIDLLHEDSVCYCAGAGEDITFDLALQDRLGCEIHCIDPTPRARRHVEPLAGGRDRFSFHAVGLWREDGQQRFFQPAKAEHVSHSIVNLQATDDYFEADCKRLSTLMRDLGHDAVDLLKLDIEGAEYAVLESLARDRPRVDILCVEFDELNHTLDSRFLDRIADAIRSLAALDYHIAAIDRDCNYTFIHRRRLDAPFS